MADEIAELVVKITGDASGLESTINGVSSELSKLEKVQGKSTAANGAATKGLAAYKKQMSEAESTLNKSRAALANTKKAYEDNQKSVTKNISTLKSQKTELDKQIALRSNEKRLLTEANKHLDKNSVAYKDNQKALKWVNTEISSYAEQGRKITESIRTQESALAGSKKAYEDAQATVSKATKQYKDYEGGLKAVEKAAKAQSLQNTGKSVKDFGEGLDSATKPLQYTAMALATGGVAAAKLAIDFEDSFASVKKTVDGTPEQLDAIKQSIIDMSTVGINGHSAIPMTTAELNELAAAGGQLGISVENIADFTEVMAQMGTATNLVGEEGAATLARFMNVMNVSQDQVRNIGSTIVDLGNNSATTEAEIAAMALRMGKFGNTVGMSAADVLGYSAALSSLGIEAQMGGSAIGRTWLAIESAVANGGEGLQAFAKYSGKSAKEFKEQWSTDSNGAFNSLLKGLQSAENLTLALGNLGIENTQDVQAMMALVNGYDLVTASVERANTAYTENTALQNEFNSKAETTASKLAITKNNFIEAARGIGETLLPTISDVSAGVADFAKKLASMSDAEKKGLVSTATTVVGIGAATKVVTGGIKGIGNVIEGVGKIKGTKVFKGISSAIGAIPGPAKLAVAGIAALGIAAKVAYDAWYDSNYRWSQGLSEGNEQIKESLDKYKNLSDIQGQIKSLKLIIENPDSSKEQVDEAKSKLEEIKALLEKEYNLVINSDNSNLEEAVNSLTQAEYSDLQSKIARQMSHFGEIRHKIQEYESDYQALADAQTKAAKNEADLRRAWLKVSEIKNSNPNGDNQSKFRALAEEYKILKDYMNPAGDLDIPALWGAIENSKSAYDDAARKARDLKNSYSEAVGVAKELSNWETEIIRTSAGKSDSEGVQKALEDMSYFISVAKLDLEGYAQAAALAMNGVDSLESAWSSGGVALQGVTNDYVRAMQTFGASAKETASGAALIQNGFRTIDEAAAKGQKALDAVTTNFITKAQALNVPMNQMLQQAGLMKTGFSDLQSVIKENKLEDLTNNIISAGKEMGASTNQIVSYAALMKNGFTDVKSAVDSGDIKGVIQDIGILGTSMGMSVEQINALAHGIGLIPDNKKIEFNAEGNVYEVVDTVENKLKQLSNDNVTVNITAEGDIQTLDNAGNIISELKDQGAVSLRLNVETGNIEALNEAGDVLATIKNEPNATVTVNADTNAANAKTKELNDAPVEVKVTADTSAADTKIKELEQTVPVTVSVTYTATNSVPSPSSGPKPQAGPAPQAKGTQNFAGGLAMVNDDGSSDPRELIVDKGRAFIPEGKNVILPLSKGAKVYTAAQTKAIMSGMGIPHYAEGKDNSDAFTAAKDDWTHYTKTHAVTTSQELQKWLDFQRQYKDNEKDIWDIEEQIFSLQQKITQEINNQSKAYIEERAALNDWEEVGDSPLEAFGRIKDRNYQDLQDAKITWDDYVKNVSDAGKTLYETMLDQSDTWLEDQRKYHNMSVDDYIAGINREQQRLEEFYAADMLNYKEYVEYRRDLANKEADAIAEKNADEYAAWQKDADAWQELRSTYGDWDKYGDSEEDFLKRKIDRVKKFYEAGTISFEEFIDDTNRYSMDLYKAQEGYVDDLLQKQSDYISDLREQFSEQEQALRDSWTVADRKTDMADVSAQLDIYKGAVTDRGQQKYKELQEQMKQLQRDEELYNLQVANNATIESLEAEYKQMEEGKANILEGLRTANLNISAYVDSISDSLSKTGVRVESLLSTLIDKFDNFQINAPSYTDNKQVIFNEADKTDIVAILRKDVRL